MGHITGNYDAPCPNCGGCVRYWYFDGDCRGSPDIWGAACKLCGKDFSAARTGLADKPCEKCGGQVEYHFTLPGPFSGFQPLGSRLFCRRCGKDFADKKPATAPTKPKPTMGWTSPKRR